MDIPAIWTISKQTFNDSIRSKWLIVFSGIFFALASSVTLMSFFEDNFDFAIVAQQICDSYCPPDLVAQYLSSFIAVVYPYIPLLTLPMGATLIVEERELGTLQYIMSNPISKVDFILGRMLGMMLATTLVVVVGFGIATYLVFGDDPAQYPPFALCCLAAALLNAIMLFLSMIVSALTRRKATAVASAVIIWLLFSAVTNTGNLSQYISLKGGPWAALPAMILNPVDAAQNWAGLLIGTDITGGSTTGLIITDLFQQYTSLALSVILVGWLVVCFMVAFLLFRHQDVT